LPDLKTVILPELGFADASDEVIKGIQQSLKRGMKLASEAAIDSMEGLDDNMRWMLKDSMASSMQSMAMGMGMNGDMGMHNDMGMHGNMGGMGGMGGSMPTSPFDMFSQQKPIDLLENGGLTDILAKMGSEGMLDQLNEADKIDLVRKFE
jgi:hypothetical protein